MIRASNCGVTPAAGRCAITSLSTLNRIPISRATADFFSALATLYASVGHVLQCALNLDQPEFARSTSGLAIPLRKPILPGYSNVWLNETDQAAPSPLGPPELSRESLSGLSAQFGISSSSSRS